MVKLYRTQRREACSALLGIVKAQMEAVLTLAPDADTLETLALARRLYTPASVVYVPCGSTARA